MPHVDLKTPLQEAEHRGGARLQRRAGRDRGRALPELRSADGILAPSSASSATPASTSARSTASRSRRTAAQTELEEPAQGAAAEPGAAAVRLGAAAADGARDAQGRESLRALRAVRGALPDGRLGHAEIDGIDSVRAGRSASRRGTVAKQQKSRVNDFVLKIANVNGTGSASANSLLMKAVFRMGVPVSGKNFFPSNIQGLPTWYEIRVSKDGYLARSGAVDIMVAMNAQTYARDLQEVRAGRRPDLRLDLAARPAAGASRHHDHRRAARADVQRAIHERAHAGADEEHGLRRRARGAARARSRRDRSAGRRRRSRASTRCSSRTRRPSTWASTTRARISTVPCRCASRR